MTLKTACAMLLLLGLPTVASAQRRDTTTACCRVVRLDAANGQVTARETATGYTFRFAVKDRRIRAAIKIGDAVWADFATKAVKLNTNDSEPCCAIVQMPAQGAHPNPSATTKQPEK
jgi:Cu/Ag efflux protein CusF